MIEFIKPHVEKTGLRNALKLMNQKYPILDEEASNYNDTDSEKRKILAGKDDEGKDVTVRDNVR